MGGTQNLCRLIGKKDALQIIKNAAVDITPPRALEMKIIQRTAAPRDLINEAYIFATTSEISKQFNPQIFKTHVTAEKITAEIRDYLKARDNKPEKSAPYAPLAGLLTEMLFSDTRWDQYMDGLLYEFEVFCYLQQTEDCREGITAMTEERAPLFKGR